MSFIFSESQYTSPEKRTSTRSYKSKSSEKIFHDDYEVTSMISRSDSIERPFPAMPKFKIIFPTGDKKYHVDIINTKIVKDMYTGNIQHDDKIISILQSIDRNKLISKKRGYKYTVNDLKSFYNDLDLNRETKRDNMVRTLDKLMKEYGL